MNCNFDDFNAIFSNEEFLALAREDAIRILSWDDLTRRVLPSGWTLEEVWNALFTLRRIGSFYIPITYDKQNRRNFYYPSRRFIETTAKIAGLTSANSPLYYQAQQKESLRFKYKSLVKETGATAKLDGIHISDEQIQQLLYVNRSPATLGEKIIVNSFELLNKLPSMTNLPFSEELFTLLYDLLTKDISEKELLSGLSISTNDVESVGVLSNKAIYDYANDISTDPFEPPIVSAIMVREAIQFLKPFPCLNSTMAWMIFRLYAIKHDYSVIAYLPIVHTTLQWEEGLLPESSLSYGFSQDNDRSPMKENLVIMGRTPDDVKRFVSIQEYSCELFPNEGDVSRWVVINLDLMLVALEHFQNELSTGLIDMHELAIDTELNYRQQSIILRAKRNPSATFSISYHQKANSVAYATARADLMELAEKGYLQKVRDGKKFIFIVGDKLK